jgi:hypothetical protein
LPGYRYTAFGLTIQSDLELKGWLEGSGVSYDVAVRVGSIPPELKLNPVFEGEPDSRPHDPSSPTRGSQLVLAVNRVADYLIADGREIVIEPRPGSDEAAVRIFLQGSAFGAILYQRGLFPLHASAVATPKGAILFAGPSGSGKSTIAAAMHRIGYPLLADDICSIAAPLVYPSGPNVFLWRDSLQELGKDPSGLNAIRRGVDKFIVPLTAGYAPSPMPIHSVFILEAGAPFEIAPVEGLHRVSALWQHAWRSHFAARMNLDSQVLEQICGVVVQARVMRLMRPAARFPVVELAERIRRDLGI